MSIILNRRSTLLMLAGSMLSACAGEGARGAGKLFVGDQRGGSRVVLQGAKRLDNIPYEIIWSQFPNAAPLLEALNAGAIDSGIGGDSAFIFAAGTNAKIKAIGAQATRGIGPVVLVRRDSPIRSLADLAGHKVATPRGSVSHNHVLAVLEAYGQPYDAVTFAFLSPFDGRAALQSGAVDAWAIWDPNAAMAEQEGARILPGKQDLVSGYALMFGREGAIAYKRGLLQDYHDRLMAGWDWSAKNRDAYADLMHKDTGLAIDILRIMQARADRVPARIDDMLIARQQETADRYLRAGVIDRKLDVRPLFDASFS
ncbi:aliphatic sulfonate ABC transporter substrate-binding protein [Sphingobium sp.]|uniref:aliphatic sulfonate ABC transporter substrate-binding protein n=1 Tax=Sphingobium sp. TaxID=1912891 RepID=UPI002BB69305|nr:aliphatic sulfonate ABC transporter substrate-binding protein [Sphingobium sp.]HUD90905.1 aliphatic sulfonate ABC transporter substrate-binding protein [Sphingobium sp.]